LLDKALGSICKKLRHLQGGQHLLADGHRGHIGLWIHAGRSGQGPHVLGAAVGKSPACLLRDAAKGLLGSDQNCCYGFFRSVPGTGDHDQGIAISRSQSNSNRFHLISGHTIGGKLIGVENAPHTRPLGPVGHLRAQPAIGLDLPAHQAGEARQPAGQDYSAIFQGAGENLGIGFSKEICDILCSRVYICPAPDQLLFYLQQPHLAQSLKLYHLVHQVQSLDPLDLHPGSAFDRDIDILADGP